MIDRQRDRILFCCDTCGDSLDTGESEFDEANAARRDAGWTAWKVEGEWVHFCSERCAR